MQLKAGALESLRAGAVSASYEATDVVAVRGKSSRQHAADEPGGAGDQDAAAHAAASTARGAERPSTSRSSASAELPIRLKASARSGSASLSRPFSQRYAS